MTSPSLPRWTLTAGGVALALGAGIMIGRVSSSSSAGDDSGAGGGHGRGAGRAGDQALSKEERAQRRREEARLNPAKVDADISKILESTNRLDRTQRLLAFLDRLPTDQFSKVYEDMRNSPLARLQGSERSLVLQAWAERDPLAALGFLQQSGADDWERETAVAAWAANDPQAAFGWAAAAEDAGETNNWQLGAARGIASTNPELARDYLAQLQGRTREQALGAIQPYVMQYGFEYAKDWIANVTDPEIQGQASRSMARNLADMDPVQAGAWNAAITDTDTRRDVSETVSDSWARRDLEAAKTWVSSLPEDTKTEAAEGVARQYAQQDPAAAAQWLAGLGNNPDLDGARRIYIEESFRGSPEASLNFVANLSDERAREGYYWRYVSGWMRNDATAAKAWMNQNAGVLPPQLVERMNNRPQ